MLTLYLTCVIVALILRHQERRHRMESTRAYEMAGTPAPPSPPKLREGESWVHIVLGSFLAVGGCLVLAANLAVMKELEVPRGQWEFSAVMLAAGFTLFFLGVRSLMQNKKSGPGSGDRSAV